MFLHILMQLCLHPALCWDPLLAAEEASNALRHRVQGSTGLLEGMAEIESGEAAVARKSLAGLS